MKDEALQIGRYDIFVFNDGLFEAKAEYLNHLDGPEASASAVERWGKTSTMLDVNCFALRSPDGDILIDTGAGTAWGPGFGHARPAMEAKGFTPESITCVLLTHIHGDHAYGLLNDDGTAYFPNADILVPHADLAFFGDPALRETVSEARRGGFTVADKMQRAYGARIRSLSAGPIFEGIEAVPLPGHTPGQMGYRLQGSEDDLLILADALHIAELQLADPKLGLVFDLDPVQSAATRLATLEQAAQNGWIVGGGHLHGFGRIERAQTGFRMIGL